MKCSGLNILKAKYIQLFFVKLKVSMTHTPAGISYLGHLIEDYKGKCHLL